MHISILQAPLTQMPFTRTGRALRSMLDASQSTQTMCANLLDAMGATLDVSGPLPRQPSILIANHLGAMDALAIASLLELRCVAKHEIAAWPFLGDILRRRGVLFVQRGDAMSGALVLRQAARAIAEGTHVLCFAEGTSTNGEPPRPFMRGMFGLAQRIGAPVVPVALAYQKQQAHWYGDHPFLPHFMELVRIGVGHVRVHFDPVVAPKSGSPEAFAEAVRKKVRARFLELRFAGVTDWRSCGQVCFA